jgi:hypothetical protein
MTDSELKTVITLVRAAGGRIVVPWSYITDEEVSKFELETQDDVIEEQKVLVVRPRK